MERGSVPPDDAATRVESDTMGDLAVPASSYWGAQTQRAVQNFDISDRRIPIPMIEALGAIKRLAAEVNGELGEIDATVAGAIALAAGEVAEGKWGAHFPVDVYQTGSGTSWNMNANEVIAHRANAILGGPPGSRPLVHPNDHVNRGQSSNDVIPSAIQIANRRAAGALVESLSLLAAALQAKAAQFADVAKIGRTHLQDAVPMTLGQEFSRFAAQIRKGIGRVGAALPNLEELALGGTAVGTGVNAHPELAVRVVARLRAETGLPFRLAENPFEAIACRDAQAELMSALDTLAGSLLRICDDLCLLASGPRTGLGEIILPALQPGSSIMPGKVNPVIPEAVAQVAVAVKGRAHAVRLAASRGPLELNTMMPLIASETLEALSLLTNASRALRTRCIGGIEADRERCASWIEWSLALVTPLVPEIGYERAAAIARQAHHEKKTVRQVLIEQAILPLERIDALLGPRR